MAWLETQRLRSGKIFQDDGNPEKFAVDCQAGTRWHYSETYGAGTYDNEVDFTPERITAGGYDGWRVTAAPWHYFLGIYPGSAADGWVGFGGRKGQHALWFRLLRLGFLRWSTRDWWDIGGAPDYDRANLSRETKQVVVNTTQESIPVEVVASWGNLWATPGGGAVSARWRADGNRLKEEITINQEGRDWIAANRNPLEHWPGASLDDIYYGYVFRLDPADIPRWVKGGVLQDMEGDFDDDDGQSGITLENAAQEFLAFLPVDDAIVYDGNGVEVDRLRLRKRIYKDGSDYYLLVGARADLLNGLADGDLVFDPTVDDQVAGGDDDGYETQNDGGFSSSETIVRCYSHTNINGRHYALFRFNPAIPQGATIDTAYWEGMIVNDTYDDADFDIHAEDVDDSNDLSTEADIYGRPRTTAAVTANDLSIGETWYGSAYEIKTVIQEPVDRASFSDASALSIICAGADDTVYSCRFDSYEAGSSVAAKLHVEYTAGGAEAVPSLLMMMGVG